MANNDTDSPGLVLSGLLRPLQRSLLRIARTEESLPDLPNAQVEVLRALVEGGPQGTVELSRRVGVTSSTLSNLLRTMDKRGLVARARGGGEDQRRVAVHITAAARDLLDRYDASTSGTIDRALAAMPAAERETIENALPALRHLVEVLRTTE